MITQKNRNQLVTEVEKILDWDKKERFLNEYNNTKAVRFSYCINEETKLVCIVSSKYEEGIFFGFCTVCNGQKIGKVGGTTSNFKTVMKTFSSLKEFVKTI